MITQKYTMKLAKFMIAMGWTDHRLEESEINALKDLLFQLPHISGEMWAELEIYMDSHVCEGEGERLLDDLLDSTTKAEQKALVIETVTDLFKADGVLSDEERWALDELKESLDRHDTGFLGRLGRSVAGAITRRKKTAAEGPNREQRLDDFVKNIIYYKLARRLESEGRELNLPEDEVRKICLAAGLMSRVAWRDARLSEREEKTIVDILTSTWGLPIIEARLVVEISIAPELRDLDRVGLCRGFYEFTNHEDRLAFVRCLFQIANACGKTSNDEIEKIRVLADGLKLTRREFIAAKLTIDREDRAGL